MRLLVLFMLVAVRLHAADCTPQSTGPCTPGQAEKDAILNLIRDARDSDDARKLHASLRDSAYRSGDYIAAEEESNLALASDARMNELLTQALDATRAAYHVGPRATSGSIVAPKDPLNRGAWTKDIQTDWNPQVVFDYQEVHRMYGPQEGPHYAGGEIKPAEIAGYTYVDGTVKILAQTLFNALSLNDPQKANPGVIAAVLDHEAQHFNDLLTSGISSKEEFELRAYASELRDADIFELTPEQKDVIRERKDHFDAALKAGLRDHRLSSYFPDTKKELDLSIQYDDAQKQLRIFEAKAKEISRLAAEQRQQEYARQVEEEKSRVMNAAMRAIQGCWFEPDYRQNGHVFTGFKAETNTWPSAYAIDHRMTLEQLKVGIMFARACLSATVRQLPPNVAGMPCNEAFVITDQHWSEPGFKEDSRLKVVPEEQARCIGYLQDHWSAPMTLDKFRRMIPKARAEYERVVDDRWRQAEADRKQREASERARREDREDQDRETERRGALEHGHPPPPLHCGFDSNGARCW